MLLALIPFSLSLSAAWILLVLLIGCGVAFSVFAYRHTVPDISRGRRAALVALRSTAIAILIFVLFEPVLNLLHIDTLEPRIALLMDDSRSLTIADPSGLRSGQVRSFISGPDAGALRGAGALSAFRFAGRTVELGSLKPDSMTFSGGETDIEGALRHVRKQLAEQNLRAVVLVSDGVSTTGRNPLHAAEALGVPVYTIGVGDSAEQTDIFIGGIIANDIAYIESVLPIDVTVRATGAQDANVQVTLRDGGNVVDRKPLQIHAGNGEYPVRFSYTPKEEGMRKMTVEVTPIPNELTPKNNRRSFFIKVLKSRMNIVMLAGAPSPDVSLVEQALSKDRNITVSSFIQKLGPVWYGNAPTEKTFTDADCILLIGYPDAQSSDQVLQQVRNAVEKSSKPLFIIFSRDLDLAKLRRHLDAWLPVEVVQDRREEMQASFVLHPDQKRNPITASGLPNDVWDRLPPLFKTEASYKARAGSQTLATLRISGIAFNEPMLAQRRLGSSKTLLLTGYGLWRWQLAYDVYDGRVPEILIANAIRWLTTREDNKRFSVKPARESFDSGEPIEFTGQVYNESLEPVSDAVVNLKVKGEQMEREMSLSPLGAGRYAGTLEGLPEGDYTFSGTATVNSSAPLTDAGRFTVGEQNAEFIETRMNNALLRQIAARTGGRYFAVNSTAGLVEAIKSSRDFIPVERTQRTDIQLWNLAYLLALAVLLFGAEWFLRKRAGMI
jgi:hypothetical protein